MSYRPDIDATTPLSPVVGTVQRDTSGVLNSVRSAIASRGTGLAPSSGMGYNPTTREFAVDGKIIGRQGIGQLEEIIPKAMQRRGATNMPVPPLPPGFEEVNLEKFSRVLADARSNPEGDLGAFIPNAAQAGGAIVSGIGTLLRNQKVENPFKNAGSDYTMNQAWDEQAASAGNPFTSPAALVTNLATAGGQAVPLIAGAAVGGPIAGAVLSVLSSGGQQGDAALDTLMEAIREEGEAGLMGSSPNYRAHRQAGMTHEQAVEKLGDDARMRGGGVGAIEGGLSAILGIKLFNTVLTKAGAKLGLDKAGFGAFSPLASQSMTKRVLGASTIGGVAEGGGAILGDLAVNERARDLVDKDASFTGADAWQSFKEEAPLGFVFGALGGIPGRTSTTANTTTSQNTTASQNTQLSDEAAALSSANTGIAVPPRLTFADDALEAEYVGEYDLSSPRLPAPVQQALPAPAQLALPPPVVRGTPEPAVDYGAQGPVSAPNETMDMFDPRTGEPTNVGPAQGQLPFGDDSNPSVPPATNTAPMQEQLPLVAQTPVAVQENLFPAMFESPMVADYFNKVIRPTIRMAEDEAGRATANTEEVVDAEAMSAEQAISSIKAAQKEMPGIIPKGQANIWIAQIRQRAAKDEATPKAAAVEATSPAPTPPGDVTSETPVVPTAVVAPIPATTPKVAKAKAAVAEATAPTPKAVAVRKRAAQTSAGPVTVLVPNEKGVLTPLADAPPASKGAKAKGVASKRATPEVIAPAPIAPEVKKGKVKAEEIRKAGVLETLRRQLTAVLASDPKLVSKLRVYLRNHYALVDADEFTGSTIKTARDFVDTVNEYIEDADDVKVIFDNALSDAPVSEGENSPPKPQESSTTSETNTGKTTSSARSKPTRQRDSRPSRPASSVRNPTTVERFRAAVGKLTGKNPPKIVTHETADTLPQSIKDSLLGWETVEGVYDPATGEIHLVAANTETGRESIVVAHELIGHYGVENVMGDGSWGSIVADIRRLRRDPKFAKFFGELDARYGDLDESTHAKELLAILAERKQGASILRRAVRAIQRGLSRLGVSVGAQDILDHLPESIHGTLKGAEQFVAIGTGTTQKGSPLASRAGFTASMMGAAKGATKGRTADILKGAVMKFWNTRDLQAYYGVVSTRWGKAYDRLVSLSFEKVATAQRQLTKVSHVMNRYTNLSKEARLKIQELMLLTQELGEINPAMTFEQNTWLSKTPERIAQSQADYDRVKKLYDNELTDIERGVFNDLATANSELEKAVIEQKIRNYDTYSQRTPEEGGLPKDITDKVVKAFESALEGIKMGKVNFSMQRTGDWLVSVPEVESESSRHATKEEAKAAARAATDSHPYLKVKIKEEDNGYVVYVSEPQLYTFDTEREAQEAIPEIEANLKKHFKEHFDKVHAGDPATAKQAAEDAFDNSWWGNQKNPTDTASTDRYTNVVPMLRTQLYDDQISRMFSPELLSKLNALKGKGMTENAYNKLLEDYMTMTERSAFRKSQVTRRLILGADPTKMTDAYIRRYASTAQALAESKFAVEENTLLADLNDREAMREFKQKTGKTPERGINQLLSSQAAVNSMMKDTAGNRLLTNIRAAVSFLNLGLSPSFMLLNAMQPYMVGVPWLASKTIKGHQVTADEAAKAVADAATGAERLKAILNAVAESVKADFKVMAGSPDESKEQWSANTIAKIKRLWAQDLNNGTEREFIKHLNKIDEEDALTLSYTNDLYDAMNMDSNTDKVQRALRMAMAGAKLTEVINRFTMARASYELGTKYGLKDKELTKFINQSIYQTQGDFSRANRAEAFNHPVWGTALQFKTYVQLMYSLFASNLHSAIRGDTEAKRTEGRRMILGMLSTHAAAGGLGGLGYIGSGAKLAAVMLGFGATDDDEEHYLTNDLDLDTQFRKGMRELTGSQDEQSMLANAIGYGLPALAGMDISERAQIPRLLDTRYIRVDDQNEVGSTINGTLAQVLGGAPLSTATRVAQSLTNMWEAGTTGNSAKFISSIAGLTPPIGASAVKAFDLATKGAVDSSGRDIGAGEINGWDLLVRGLGVQPFKTSEAQRNRSEYFDIKNDTETERSALLKNLRAATGGDVVRARKAIAKFNATHPKEVHITSKTLSTSAKSGSSAMRNKVDEAYRRQLN